MGILLELLLDSADDTLFMTGNSGLKRRLERLKESLAARRGGFAGRVALLSGTTVLGQGILVAVSPLLTRLYDPGDLGKLAVYIAASSIGLTVVSLRYELAIPVVRTVREASSVLALCITLSVATALLLLAAITVAPEAAMRVTGVGALGRLAFVIPATLAVGGAYQALTFWSIRVGAIKPLAQSRLRQSVAQAAFQVSLGAGGAGAAGLLSSDVLARAIGFRLLARPARPALSRRSFHPRSLLRTGSRQLKFAALGTPAALLNALALNLPALALAAQFGAASAGLFALAQRVVGIPLRVVGQAVAEVYLAESAVLARTDKDRLRTLYIRTLFRLAIVGILPVAAFGLAGPVLFSAVFGAEWRTAGVYTRYLAVPFLLQFLASPLSQTLLITNRQHQQLYFDIVRAGLVAGVFGYAALRHTSDEVTIAMYSASMALTYFWHLALSWAAVRSTPA